MASQPYNLDQDVQESFKFILKGNTYTFKHLNSEEMAELTAIKNDNQASTKFLAKFITADDPKAPSFEEVQKTLTIPSIRNFFKMLASELSLE